MRYYLGKNGQEYTNPEDAVKYGEGLEGYREVIVKQEKISYEKLTGNEAPVSPVDHILPTEPQKPIAEIFNATPAPTPSPLEAKLEAEEKKIVATEPVNVAQPTEVFPYSVEFLEKLTDEQLKVLCKERRTKGLAFMKRATMIMKLSTNLTETK